MPVQRVPSIDPAAVDHGAIFEQMAAGALILDAVGIAIGANAAARRRLSPVEPAGLGFGAVLGGAAKAGVLSQREADAVADWVARGAVGPHLCELSDSTVLAFTWTTLADGGALIEIEDVTAHRQAAQIAHRDPLTGLPNRVEFRLRLEQTIAHCLRTGETAAVLCIDLDRFKSINDTLGHPMGDLLLKAVADRMRGVLRTEDVVARLGGDEFAVLQPGSCTPGAAETLAARLIDLIGRTYVIKGHMLNIGASVGVAMIPGDGEDADQILKNADLALYRAKGDGRGVFRFFEPEMNARMQARRLMEIDLRKALAMRQFQLAFQPQVTAATGAIVGFETLIRWDHPTRGVLDPETFIPLAEEIGLIVPIGEWVLRTACREAARWEQPVNLAVNLSAVQFRSGDLVQTVVSALASSGLDAARLELEITENVLLQDTERVLDTLRRLRALGVTISMDDFGTGYSSLSYLQKFPFSKIKIDQSFVRAMVSDPDSAAIVRAVAALGASLGMQTTAGGVETPEQLAQVQIEGCQQVQGVLTGGPVTAAAAAALLIPQPEERQAS